MHALAEIKKKAHTLDGQCSKKYVQLRELQRKCHHPRFKEKQGNTVCAICEELIFFSTRVLSEEGLIELGKQCAKVQSEIGELNIQLAEVRKHCPHPKESIIMNPEDAWCSICLENWWDIQKRKETATATTR